MAFWSALLKNVLFLCQIYIIMLKSNHFIKKAILVFAFVLSSVSIMNAQWTSPGNGTTYTLNDLVEVSGCVSFDPAIFYYFITGDITISANDKLYINRNDGLIYIVFANDYTITIKGSMEALGQDEEHYLPIGMSGHLRFEDTSDPSFLNYCWFGEMNGIQIINSEVTFDDCRFHYFYSQQQSSTVNVMNCDPVFDNCEFYFNEGAAISSPANGQGSPQIFNCQFTNNVTTNANQPQINLGPGSQDTIRIVNCTIEGEHDMSGGIAITDLMGTGETKILLKDNVIKNNRYGYNQQGYKLSSVINGNQFIDNNLETNPMNGGSGISIYGMDGNNKAIIRNNVITSNLWGITAIYFHDIDLGTENDWGNNKIYNNGNDGVIYDLYNNSSCDFMAVGNYWGTFNEDEIEEHIVHQPDNPSFGLVTYIPFINDDAVNEIKTTGFEVCPNPVSNGSFNLILDEVTPSEMMIYNIKGQEVLSQYIENKVNTINVDALESGVYLVKIRNAKETMVRRIIIVE